MFLPYTACSKRNRVWLQCEHDCGFLGGSMVAGVLSAAAVSVGMTALVVARFPSL